MKKAKKFLVGLLAFASVSVFALGVAACGDDNTGDNTTPAEKTEIEQVYDSYVEYANEQGQTPLDYETWLNTIQGADGVGIKSVEVDDDGMMIITLTDGTVLPAIELPTGEPIEKGATSNLHYQKIAGKEEYRVIGLGLASENDIVISSTYNGLPVTEIGDYAFSPMLYESNITSIEIPDSVKTIGEYAFAYCTNLPSVIIPNSVRTIEDYAFYGCTKLENITIGNLMTTVAHNAFYGTPYHWADSYVICVTDANGEAMADVQIGICDYDTGRCITPKKTDENGKVVFTEMEATYVLNSNVSTPNGYEWKDDNYQFTEYGEYTLILVEKD